MRGSSVDAAPASVDAMAAPVDAAPAPVDAAPAPVDAPLVLQRARELYPTAKRVAVEGDVFAVLSFVDTPLFDPATRFVRRVFQSFVASRFAKRPTQPVYILLFTTRAAFDDTPGPTTVSPEARTSAASSTSRARSSPMCRPASARCRPSRTRWRTVSSRRTSRARPLVQRVRGDRVRVPAVGEGRDHGAKWSLRFTLLSQTLSSPATAPETRFNRFFGMEDNEFRGIDPAIGVVPTSRNPALEKAAEARGRLHFASARYACLWLDDLDPPLLTPFYEAWRDTFASDRTGGRLRAHRRDPPGRRAGGLDEMGGEAGRIDAGEEIGRNPRQKSADRVVNGQPRGTDGARASQSPGRDQDHPLRAAAGGYPKEEVDDGVREVVASVFEYLEREKETIETPDRMQAVVRTPSYSAGRRPAREGEARRTSVGPTDEADDHEAPASSHEDRLDMRRALETMEANKQGKEGALIQGLAAGVSQKEIAAKLDVSHAQLRKETVAMRSRHGKLLRGAGYGGVVVGLFALLVVIFRMKYGPDEQAKPQPAARPDRHAPGPP